MLAGSHLQGITNTLFVSLTGHVGIGLGLGPGKHDCVAALFDGRPSRHFHKQEWPPNANCDRATRSSGHVLTYMQIVYSD